MKNFKIKIPEPCHKGWDKMTPNEKGRFCDSCSKTVVDFTTKTSEEIKEYFLANRGNRICGHFKKAQLDSIVIQIPNEVFTNKLTFKKLFLLALLLTMGSMLFSCKTDGKRQVIGEVQVIDSITKTVVDTLDVIKKDSLKIPIAKTVPPKENIIPPPPIPLPELKDDTVEGLPALPEAIVNEELGEAHFSESEELYIPEIPPKYDEIKTKIIQLLNTCFKDEIKLQSIEINISTYSHGKNEEIYVKVKNKEIQQKIKSELKINILPLILIEVEKDKEYNYFQYNYKIKL